VDGDEKAEHIRSAKLLLNTSVWEGIPISWLEALSYGTLIVSAFDRDNIVGRFGTYVGEISGNGTEEEDLDKLAGAVRYWIEHDCERQATAERAIEFVRGRHSIAQFQESMREEILLQAR
jgi:glycosyltransferase involved in cell wall biosynthesis